MYFQKKKSKALVASFYDGSFDALIAVKIWHHEKQKEVRVASNLAPTTHETQTPVKYCTDHS
jgi:hypothetical protein